MRASERKVKRQPERYTVGAEQVRKELGVFIDRAWDGEVIVITRHDRERCVLLGWRQYEAAFGGS